MGSGEGSVEYCSVDAAYKYLLPLLREVFEHSGVPAEEAERLAKQEAYRIAREWYEKYGHLCNLLVKCYRNECSLAELEFLAERIKEALENNDIELIKKAAALAEACTGVHIDEWFEFMNEVLGKVGFLGFDLRGLWERRLREDADRGGCEGW